MRILRASGTRRRDTLVHGAPALCGTVPNKLFYDYFGTGDAWTVNAGDCKVYTIRRRQLPVLAARTNFDR